MTIYHGSENIIEKPIYGYGKKYNDYGLGFYCTEDSDLSMEWSVAEDRDGYSNRYELNITELKLLDLTAEDYNVLNWIAILLENRFFDINTPIAAEAKKHILYNFLPDYQDYDVIKGYRADDSYFSFARDFINNTISLEQLGRAMKLGNLGEQIVLKSEKAFGNIKYIDNQIARKDLWFPKKENRDSKARMQYQDMDKLGFRRGEIYVVKILEEGIRNDDLRIR